MLNLYTFFKETKLKLFQIDFSLISDRLQIDFSLNSYRFTIILSLFLARFMLNFNWF